MWTTNAAQGIDPRNPRTHHDPHLGDLEARVKAMVDLIEHPNRWGSKKRIVELRNNLCEKCAREGRYDLKLNLMIALS